MPAPFPAACVYLTGPTASGKTAVGIELARRLNAEIVAMDSMTVYRGLEIGTAKPTAEERAAAPHHLLDVVDPSTEFSQAEYAAAARTAVDDILARGKLPLLVGGTPLYLKTLLRGMYDGPPPDWNFRRRMETEADDAGPTYLQDRLAQVDPPAAAKLHANDRRRLIRALEVFELTGRPLSEQQREFEHPRRQAMGRVFLLDWPRAELFARIESRVDAMLAAGLVDETRQALAQPGGLGRTARQGLGYREVLDMLEGRLAPEDLADAIKTHTRQFAKRQGTWFRSLEECRRIEMHAPADAAATAQQIAANLAPA
ncbi:MAG: tRNA (adenosine(37)-N6)-dimethylallyltransferase MiaA [Pirellulales bacterium]